MDTGSAVTRLVDLVEPTAGGCQNSTGAWPGDGARLTNNAIASAPLGLDNAPDIWDIVGESFSDRPWIGFLAAVLSWVALFYGMYRGVLAVARRVDELLAAFSARPDRAKIIARLATAFVLAWIPILWLVTAVPWGNAFQLMASDLNGHGADASTFDLTLGSVLSLAYALCACTVVTVQYWNPGGSGIRHAVTFAAPPAIPAVLSISMIRGEADSVWPIVSGIGFIGGYFVAPAIVIVCVRLCGLRR
ncbi:hypothetical protein ACIBCN_38465 [Nocardia sp. NPDC051052]|uniref:hypothetical protein n=1 Tax=Nocardia sp. NPDC051052 TaxID=3364322 RepID=UPI0037A64B01